MEVRIDELNKLIGIIRENGACVQTAITNLFAFGNEAVQPIIEEVRQSPLNRIRVFTQILLAVSQRDLVSVMGPLLDDDHVNLELTAYEGLAQSKDILALPLLLGKLADGSRSDFRRSLAARALGELGFTCARTSLIEVVHEVLGPAIDRTSLMQLISSSDEFDEDRLRLVLEIAIAMAKLGDHELLSVPVAILACRSGQDNRTIRAEAARAFQYIVGPGLFPSIQEALHDDAPEVRLEAIDAIFYLGVKESISELVFLTQDNDEEVAEKAKSSILKLADKWLNGSEYVECMSTEEFQEWWSHTQDNFDASVCYRLGEPMRLFRVTELLKPQAYLEILRELLIITGQDFSVFPFSSFEEQTIQSRRKAERWFEGRSHLFEPGHLYKYGFQQDLSRIF